MEVYVHTNLFTQVTKRNGGEDQWLKGNWQQPNNPSEQQFKSILLKNGTGDLNATRIP